MTALRQQAYDLLDAMPDGDLCLVVDILEALKRNKHNPRSMILKKKPFDFSKYGKISFFSLKFGFLNLYFFAINLSATKNFISLTLANSEFGRNLTNIFNKSFIKFILLSFFSSTFPSGCFRAIIKIFSFI